MADPTSIILHQYQTDVDRATYVIKDAEALQKGGFISLDLTTGKAEFGGTDAHVPVGIALEASTGLPADLTGNAAGDKKVVTRGNIDIEYDVTGVTGLTNIGAKVFSTDGSTLSLTNPGSLVAAGYVKGHVSGTKAIVHLYDFKTAQIADAADSAGGGGGGV